ncbi:MAG: hypothetical protein ABFE01_15605 [Phycisphaerales bacterium]
MAAQEIFAGLVAGDGGLQLREWVLADQLAPDSRPEELPGNPARPVDRVRSKPQAHKVQPPFIGPAFGDVLQSLVRPEEIDQMLSRPPVYQHSVRLHILAAGDVLVKEWPQRVFRRGSARRDKSLCRQLGMYIVRQISNPSGCLRVDIAESRRDHGLQFDFEGLCLLLAALPQVNGLRAAILPLDTLASVGVAYYRRHCVTFPSFVGVEAPTQNIRTAFRLWPCCKSRCSQSGKERLGQSRFLC